MQSAAKTIHFSARNAFVILANFNDSSTSLEGADGVTELFFEYPQQRLFSAIADSDPQQFSRVAGPICEVKKIFIPADHDPVSFAGVIPNIVIRRLVHPDA